MIFLEEYGCFNYTRISVPIVLDICPSDIKENKQIIDIDCDRWIQKQCYIGSVPVIKILIQRIRAQNTTKLDVPKWKVEVDITGVLQENRANELVTTLCDYLTLQCAKQDWVFQHNGLSGFSYQPMEVRRQYAVEYEQFGDYDFNHYGGAVYMEGYTKLKSNLFMLPEIPKEKVELQVKMEKALISALQSRDAISRYLLLYYLFEMIYETEEYINLKRDNKFDKAEALFHYLKAYWGVAKYNSFSKEYELTSQILREIIRVRNDLAHRADTSEVAQMMYHHLLPILQTTVRNTLCIT